jgi:branched-chain amino acid transport system permease protein
VDWGRIIANALEALVGVDAVYFALAAIGLNVHFGFTGLLNFGQSAFLAMGAYGLAVSVTTWGLPFWVGILVGLGGAVGLAILLGIPPRRLRGDYVAIVTIAAAEIIRLIVRSAALEKTFGGSDGLAQFSTSFFDLNPYHEGEYGIGSVSFGYRTLWVMTVGWVLILLSCLVVGLLMRSPWGRVIKAIREDEDAVRSLGKNVYAYKMQSLIIGGVIGALGGFIAALGSNSVLPDTYGTETTFFAYAILILGGIARVWGPVVGSMLFWALISLTDNVLRQAVEQGHIPHSIMEGTQVGQVRFMLVGLGLVLLLVFRPQGVFGDKKEIALDAR